MPEATVCPECSTRLTESGSCPHCPTQSLPLPPEAKPLRISGYNIVERIGEGGMGAVYLAEETSLGRRVAIKVISGRLASAPQARARFMREAQSLASVEHPNVGRKRGHSFCLLIDPDTEKTKIQSTKTIGRVGPEVTLATARLRGDLRAEDLRARIEPLI